MAKLIEDDAESSKDTPMSIVSTAGIVCLGVRYISPPNWHRLRCRTLHPKVEE